MKTFSPSLRLPALLAAGLLGLLAVDDALAQLKPNRRVARQFDAAELGAARGKFEAWQRGVLGGDSFYTQADRALKSMHATAIDRLQNAMMEDRLGDEAGWKFIDRVLAVGRKAKEERGDAAALTPEQRKKATADLRTITGEAKKATANSVPQEVVTPTLNRKQQTAGELLRFGKDTESLSTAQLSSGTRKWDRLLAKESKAKDDDEVSDRERESLIEDGADLVRDLARDLAG